MCGKGQRLGQVGSRIVAEVFIGLLELDSGSFRACNPIGGHTQKKDHFTMADLLQFAGDISPLDDPHHLAV